jgi:hypothetical protein
MPWLVSYNEYVNFNIINGDEHTRLGSQGLNEKITVLNRVDILSTLLHFIMSGDLRLYCT